MSATLSILGLYNWDESIFDNLKLPIGVDKEDVVNNILLELSDMEILYPSFDYMKFAIGAWSKKELPIWNKLLATTQYEYNPIFNYDRTEEISDTETRNLKVVNDETRNLNGTNNEVRNLTGSDNEIRDLNGSNNQVTNMKNDALETRNLKKTGTEIKDSTSSTEHDSDTSGETTNKGKDTTNEFTFGFNSTTKTQTKQIENELGSGNTSTGKVEYKTEIESGDVIDTDFKDTGTINTLSSDTGTINNAITDKGTVSKSLSDRGTVDRALSDKGTVKRENADTGTITNIRTHSAKGNIGVTTTQQMINAERDVVKFNIVDYIIDSFKGRFCILVY